MWHNILLKNSFMSHLFKQFGKSVFIEWHFSNFNENFKKKSRLQLQHFTTLGSG